MAFLPRITFALALLAIPTGVMAQDAQVLQPSETQQPILQQPSPQQPKSQQVAKAPHLGNGIVCDTPQQVRRFVALHNDGASIGAALEKVNLESDNPGACAVVVSAFVENEEVAKLLVPNGIIRLVQIVVLATMNQSGWQRVPSAIRYTAVFVKAEAA